MSHRPCLHHLLLFSCISSRAVYLNVRIADTRYCSENQTKKISRKYWYGGRRTCRTWACSSPTDCQSECLWFSFSIVLLPASFNVWLFSCSNLRFFLHSGPSVWPCSCSNFHLGLSPSSFTRSEKMVVELSHRFKFTLALSSAIFCVAAIAFAQKRSESVWTLERAGHTTITRGFQAFINVCGMGRKSSTSLHYLLSERKYFCWGKFQVFPFRTFCT